MGVLGFMTVRPAIMKPIVEGRQELVEANEALLEAEEQDFELANALERISRGRETSLPPNIADAQRVYQRWITNLSELCRFAQLKVSPGSTEPRRGRYFTVDVVVEAETDLEGLTRFLYLFEQADLTHRVAALDIESTGTSKGARMDITLTAEGMSVVGSPNRSDVFPVTILPEPLAEDAVKLKLNDVKEFPKDAPFLAQIGREMVNVTEVDATEDGPATWTIQRAQQGTTAIAHGAYEKVQLFPVVWERRDAKFADYEGLVNSSPFAKPVAPRELKPRLASIADKTIAPGEEVKMTARAEDLDQTVGVVTYSLKDAADGMTIDKATGEFAWAPAEDLEPKAYPATVVVTQKNNDTLELEKTIKITIKLPNDGPQLTVPDKAVVVLGREFELQVSAKDDGPTDKLKYSLDGEVPDGLSIDSATATLKWTPDKGFSPGDYSVTVKVTDGGSPEKTDSGKIALSVRDDTAILTRFTGSVTLDGEQLAFFRDLSANKNPQFKVGDRIEAAEIDAELTEVAKRHILLADAEGIWRLNLGENLRERELVEPVGKEEPVDDEETMKAEKEEDPATTDKPTTPETAEDSAKDDEQTAPGNVEPKEAEGPAEAAKAEETPQADPQEESAAAEVDSVEE